MRSQITCLSWLLLLLAHHVYSVDQYTLAQLSVDFLVRNACSRPEASRCLFYTSGQGGLAQQIAKEGYMNIKSTIWSHWKPEFYDAFNPNNPFWDVLEGVRIMPRRFRKMPPGPKRTDIENRYRASQTYRYFENMSEALARMCHGTAYVLTPDVNNLPNDGIWQNTEYPTLTRSPDSDINPAEGRGKVDRIVVVKSDRTQTKDLWTRSPDALHSKRFASAASTGTLTAVDDDDCVCPAWPKALLDKYQDLELFDVLPDVR